MFVAKAREKFSTLLSIIWPPFQKSTKAGWLTWGCPGCLPTPRSFSGHSQSHSLDFVITLIYSTSCISDSNPDICGLSTESPPPLSLWPLLLSLLSFLARPPSSLHPPWVCGMQNRSLPAVSWTTLELLPFLSPWLLCYTCTAPSCRNHLISPLFSGFSFPRSLRATLTGQAANWLLSLLDHRPPPLHQPSSTNSNTDNSITSFKSLRTVRTSLKCWCRIWSHSSPTPG